MCKQVLKINKQREKNGKCEAHKQVIVQTAVKATKSAVTAVNEQDRRQAIGIGYHNTEEVWDHGLLLGKWSSIAIGMPKTNTQS